MITENYVSFEQAKALKELGFPQKSSISPNVYADGEYRELFYPEDATWYREVIVAPTLSLVQKWLREEKGLDISVYRYGDKCISRIETEPGIFTEKYEPVYIGYIWVEYPTSDVGGYIAILKDSNGKDLENSNLEQMLSIAIDRCIELLKETKE